MAYSAKVLANGPQAFYPLNEASGTSFLDSSGNSRTATGTAISSYRQSVPFACLERDGICGVEFNGSSSNINCGSSSYLTGATQVTIEFMARFLTIPSGGTLYFPCAVYIRLDNGFWYPAIAVGVQNNSLTVRANSTASPAEDITASYGFTDTSNWHHFVVHVDYSGDFIYIYVDGNRVVAQAASFNNNSLTIDSAAGPIFLGKGLDRYADPVYANLLLADVAIYKNVAFNWSIVSKHYHGTGFPYASTILMNSPVLYWRLNETAGAGIIDYSGNNRSGTASNIQAYQQRNTGISVDACYGLSSNGASTVINGPNTSFLSNITKLTISFWFKANSTSGTDLPLVSCQSTSAANFGFAIGFNSNSLRIYMRSVGADTLQIGEIPFTDVTSWHHVIGHWDWANKKMLLVLDGAPVVDVFVTLTNAYFTPGNNIRLFCFATSDIANSSYCSAQISEMAWYTSNNDTYSVNGVKTLVSHLFWNATRRVGIDRGQQHDALIHTDLLHTESYQVTTGTALVPQLQVSAPLSNQPYYTLGSVATHKGIYFNRTFARFRGSWSLDFSAGFSITVSARVKENSNSGVLYYCSAGGINHSIILGHETNSLDVYLKIYDGTNLIVSLTAANVLSKTLLKVLIVVFDPVAQSVSLYSDGIRVATTSFTQTLPTVTRNLNLLGSGPKAKRYEKPDPYFNQVMLRHNWNCAVFDDQINLDFSSFTSGVKGQHNYYVGSVFCSPWRSLYGATSMYFNGQSSGLVFASKDCDPSISNFCIEFWVWVSKYNASAWVPFAGQWNQSSQATSCWLIGLSVTNSYLICHFGPYSTGTLLIVDTVAFPLQIWTHVALTRSGNTFALFKNGVRVGTVSSSASAVPNSVETSLGNYFNASGVLGATGTNWLFGYITGFSVLRGSAKYLNNFIPALTMPPGVVNIENPNFLLHFNGTNGSTTFTDSCGHTMTVVRNANISTAQSKFGGSSVYFDGSGNVIRCNHLSVAAYWNDFTIECWVYLINGGHGGTWSRIFETESYGTAGGINLATFSSDNPAKLRLHDSLGTPLLIIDSINVVPNNTWTHVAVTRKEGVFKLWVNGVDQGVGVVNTHFNLSSTKLSIGASNSSSESFYGYIDEFRFINGHALYTQDFSDSLPKVPFSVGFNPYVEEVYRDYVVLGVNTNTINLISGSSYVYDYTGKSVTVAGSAVSTTTTYPPYSVYGASIAFNGTTDYLTWACDSDFDLGTIAVTTNFTAEFWVKTTSTNNTVLFAHGLPGSVGTGNKGWAITLNNGTLAFAVGDATNGHAVYSTSSPVITTGQWHCVAVVLDAGVPRIFVDGYVQAGSFTVGTTFVGKVTTNAGDGIRVGASLIDDVTTNPIDFLTGNLFNIRVTKNVCRYFSYYPIFKTSYPERNIIDYTNDIFIPSDILIMDFEGANNSTTFTDRKAHTTAALGTAKISTSNCRVGSSSGYFDGTAGCYVNVTCGSEFVLGVDFTIELWVYFTNLTGPQSLLSKYVTWATNVDFYLYKDVNHKVVFKALDSTPLTITGSTTLTANQWTHLAITRIGHHTKLFVNGLLDGKYTASAGQSIPNDQVTLRIGANNESTPSEYLTGYIDGLRIGTTCRYAMYDGFPIWTKPILGGVTVNIPFEGSHNSTVFYDADNQALVRNGTPVISTTQHVTGASSGYFNGTLSTDYLALPATTGNLANRFTIECWCWVASIPTTLPTSASAGNHGWYLFGQGGSASNQDQVFSYGESQRFNFYRGPSLAGGTINITSANSFAIKTWHHIALTSDGATWRLFVNGNLEASVTNSTSWVNTGNTFDVGRELVVGYPTWASYWNGYIDNFQITNGICKYAAAFTPDASPWAYEPHAEDSFNGWLSEFSVFSRVLSNREIQKTVAQFKNGPFITFWNTRPTTLINYYPLAESEGLVAYDIFGGGHGAYHDGVTLNQDIAIQADNITTNSALLDGVDDTVTFPAFKLGSEFTVCLILKLVSPTLNQRLLEFTAGSLSLYVTANSGEFNVISIGINTASGYQIVSSSHVDFNLYSKTLICITAKESNYLTLYVNGIVVGTPISLTTFALNAPYLNVLGSSASATNFANAYVSSLAIFGSAFDQTAITNYKTSVFNANIVSSLLVKTLDDTLGSYYQSLYYIRGTVRLDSVPTQAWVYIYCSESGAFEGLIKSDVISGEYEWRTTNNKYYNIVCMPIYNQQDWKPDTVYALGDVIIPFISTGFWYECTVAGVSSASVEPVWPVVLNATIVDNTITWKCADVTSRGQVHGPLLPYDVSRTYWQKALFYYPTEQLTFNSYVDSGFAETVSSVTKIYLNGNVANGYAGVNVNTNVIPLETAKTVTITFKRTKSGPWYDDDFTDAQFRLFFVVDQNPINLTFSDVQWGFYGPSNLGATSCYLNFRSVHTSTLGINNTTTGVVVDNGGFSSGHLDGTKETKVEFAYSGGYYHVSVYEDNVLKYSKNNLFAATTLVDCYILFHYHNYTTSPHQELISELTVLAS